MHDKIGSAPTDGRGARSSGVPDMHRPPHETRARADRNGVSDGTRTRGHLDHNQVLYQLSYTHHAGHEPGPWGPAS